MTKSTQLMAARLGLYDSGNNDVEGLSSRLEHHGGYPQQDRMIKDKYRSFLKALKYSYQGAWVSKLNELENFRALINPNKLKQDYDDKIISVDFKYNLKPGDVFEWNNTGTYWLISEVILENVDIQFLGKIRMETFKLPMPQLEVQQKQKLILYKRMVLVLILLIIL